MEDSKNKVETVQEELNAPNPSSTGADTVEQLVDEHRHHHHHRESLDIERLENSFPAMPLQFEESIASHDKIDESLLQSENLNEDCLLEIFSYLSMSDMLQVKLVCKLWYQASQQWFKQIQTLVYHVKEDHLKGSTVQLYKDFFRRKVYEKKNIDGLNDVISILHSCGHYIKYFKAYISFRGRPVTEKCEKFIFQWVPQLCKNIVNVELYAENPLKEPIELNFEFMAKNWEKLEEIETGYLSKTVKTEKNLFNLLQNNNQLKTLKLAFNLASYGLIKDNFFTCLPRTMKEICISQMSIKGPEQLSNFILASKNFTSLQSLKFKFIEYLSDAVATAIANIASLTHLSLELVARYESRGTITQIANLKGLKSLYLVNHHGLREDDIINIVESCIQLEVLVIYGRWILTDRTLAAIATLKNLKCLAVSTPDVTVESIMNYCDRLEVLWINGLRMDTSDVTTLLRNASNLRYLCFDSCKNVSEDMLEEANGIANERRNHILVISEWISLNNERPRVINTPYFKYFGIGGIPLRIFPNDIKNYINDIKEFTLM